MEAEATVSLRVSRNGRGGPCKRVSGIDAGSAGRLRSHKKTGGIIKILLVEDNELTRHVLKSMLIKLGHEIVGEAGDGDKAVRYFTRSKPDVVFLDLLLPGKSGIEVLAAIRHVDPATRVVIITAVEQEEINRQLSGKGIHAVLRKPFSFGDFKTLMRNLT